MDWRTDYLCDVEGFACNEGRNYNIVWGNLTQVLGVCMILIIYLCIMETFSYYFIQKIQRDIQF